MGQRKMATNITGRRLLSVVTGNAVDPSLPNKHLGLVIRVLQWNILADGEFMYYSISTLITCKS